MGWAKAASYALDYIGQNAAPDVPGVNTLPGGGFFEVGPDQTDGAIVGRVWLPEGWVACRYHAPDCRQCGGSERVRVVRHAGAFRIEPDGTVSRFPGISAALRRRAKGYSRQKS